MKISLSSSSRLSGNASALGFTLIEMAVVIVIVGIVISIVATILPSLIQSAKIKKAQAILEKVDYALQGYSLANHRLPYADTDQDGQENTGEYLGDLPYITLGLSSNEDAWGNPIRYGVYDTLAGTFPDGDAFCNAISNAATTAFTTSKVYTTTADNCSADQSNSSNQAYVVASGGPKDLDGSNGFFDLCNGQGTSSNPGFNFPGKIQSTTYDDLVRALSLNELNQKNCTGGGGGGGGGTGAENTDTLCSDGVDNDGDGYIDCHDQDCCRSGLTVCSQCPPQDAVQINTSAMPEGTVGASYTHTFQATGGSGYYYWYLDSITPSNIPGLSISLWNGTLSGTIDNCEGSYTVTVRVEDRYDSAKTDSHSFTLTVSNGTLTVSPGPKGGGSGNPDFTVDSSTFSQDFTVNGGHVGDFNWTINWQGTDPGGFQIDTKSATVGKFWKSGATSAGDFTFTLTATDSTCSTNIVTTAVYYIHITSAGTGAPYTENLDAQWHLDECLWNGTTGEVKDSGENFLDGTAMNGGNTIGSGKTCRAGFFDGTNDYLDMGDILNGTLGMGSNSFTVSTWIYPLSLSSAQTNHNTQNCFIAKASDPYNDNLEIGITTGGRVHVYIDTQGKDTYGDFGPNGAVNLNAWTFIAVSYDNGTVRVTINDTTYEDTTTWSGGGNLDDATGSPFTVGSSQHVDNYFNGKIDEVMVFSKALDEDEIQDIYSLTHSCSGGCYEGPLAEYRMENFPWNGTANEVKDSGSGASHGVAAKMGSGSIPSQTTPSGGKVCRAGVFTRVDANNGGYLDLGDPSDGDLDPGADPWTISAWIRWDGSTGENIIYNKENLYEARVYGGYVRYAWQPHWAWDGGTSFPIAADTWTYVTTVYDGHQQILYKNGERVYLRNQSGAMGSNSSKLLIGARGSASPRNFFGGLIDEVRIYNRALAENEIIQDMNETRDCAADSVVITTTSLPDGTINSAYSTTLTATGGTTPYGWEIVPPNPISGLSIVPATGELHGTINVCAGDYDITVRVTDSASRMDERTLTLKVTNGALTISPAAPQTFNCSTSTFYQDFTVSGPRMGALGSWQIQWLGTNPGGFEVIGTGDNTARFRKIGTSTAGTGYQFKLTAADSSCPDNQVDSGFYTLNISGDGADAPYYAGMVGEWHMDECTWDGTSGELTDTSDTGAHGESHNVDAGDTVDRSVGKVCYVAALNLDGRTDQYVTLGHEAFNNLGDFSLSLWFRVESLSSSITTIFSGARSGAYNSMLIYLNSSGTSLYTWVNDSQTGVFNIGASVADGLWHHLVWTRRASDGAEIVYLDGTALSDTNGTVNTATVTLDPGGAILGQEQDALGGGFDVNQVFHGWIDEVMIYNRLLSQDEVNDLLSLTHDCSGSCYTAAVAEYYMDEDSWSIGVADEVKDSSGNGYHGTAYGSAAVNKTDSQLCYAGEFSNNDSYIEITGLPVSTTAGDKTTVCFWMKWAGNASEMPIGWGSAYDLWFRTTDQFGFNTGCSDLFGISGAGSLANDWHHVAAIFTNNAPSKNQLYIDGVLQPAALLVGSQCSRTVSSTLYISGWDANPTGYKYDGLIDEVRIYTRGLSASEVLQDMTRSHSCPE